MRVIDGDHLKSILQEYVKREEAYAESGNFFDNLFATCVAAGLLEAIHSIEEEPSVQPETYEEKLKEIADRLSEKFAYLDTCPNERDIILGYLGVKRTGKIHCDTDCTNSECKSNYRYNKLLSEESKWHDCDPTDKNTLPEPGSWAIWCDKEDHKIIARWKEDAIDHFWPDQRMFDFDLEDAVAWTEIPKRTKNTKDIMRLPSVQSEIIRCRECKHYDGRPCGIVDWYNTADDFCSRAERRQDD